MRKLLVTSCLVALTATAQVAAAQTIREPTKTAPSSATEIDVSETKAADIVVTGTRLASGFNTPTPVTVVTTEQLNTAGKPSLAEAIAQLPVFKGPAISSQPTNGSPNGTNGQSLLNLRGLGAQRNLLLLDGQRVIATNAAGSVDVNMADSTGRVSIRRCE
ncbi:TonB-dependent receptor plug domain-containing protein [Novosphingobium sp. PP1Y]|uniref:TonB-dependent receptor plug domain-containing protein n=1 Tax=Novosphingobium sp. PP1Y TaxID=702113 RepID=UPI00020EFB49|nr:TonB-dependent receptor plug domain-containing protein [Novosphingobium sp. PP1Y]CCA90039.1 TonB-dependent receptor [Novosphingobium sp. PP1Y]